MKPASREHLSEHRERALAAIPPAVSGFFLATGGALGLGFLVDAAFSEGADGVVDRRLGVDIAVHSGLLENVVEFPPCARKCVLRSQNDMSKFYDDAPVAGCCSTW